MKTKNLRSALLLLLAPVLVFNACSGSSGPSAAQVAYETRRQAFLTNTAASSSSSMYSELTRLYQGDNLNDGIIIGSDDWNKFVNREDTADFRLPGLLSILYSYGDTGQVSESFKTQAKALLLGFKYWPDELGDYEYSYDGGDTGAFFYPFPEGHDLYGVNTYNSMDDMCYYSENHYILFSVGAYLAGQLYPDDIFTASGTVAAPNVNGVADGQTGTQKMAKFRPRIMRWLELRYKSGFSEWLSNVYYNEDMPALLAIVEMSEDAEMVQKAKMVLDLMIADMAINSFKGYFQSTHGRTYEKEKMSGGNDHTGQVANLIFGLNDNTGTGNMTTVMLATSTKYRVPAVLYDIANDVSQSEFINRQRMGIVLADAADWGLDITDPASYGMTFLTMEAYMDPLFANSFKAMQDNFFLWGNGQFDAFNITDSHGMMEDPTAAGAPDLPTLAAAVEHDLARNTRTEVNIYTYRTPDYMMSTAQDWRPGLGGDQSSISQASLGKDAVFFVNPPATLAVDGGTPRYWTGNGFNPRSIQVKNVNITLYDVSADTRHLLAGGNNLYMTDQPTFTHAFLPKGHYDAFEEDAASGWYFAQKGNAYIAVYCSAPTRTWVTNSDDGTRGNGQNYELKAEDAANKKYIWITELSSTSEYATLAEFKTAILAATLTVDAAALTVTYDSPSQGTLVMNNTASPLTQNGVAVDVSDYDRYDNVYSTSGAVSSSLSTISFSHNGESLNLNWSSQTRKASSYLNK